MKELLKAAMKAEPCDLLLTGARVANVFTLEYEDVDIAVKNGVIVGLGHGYEAEEVVDCSGGVLVPGFIEGHMHIESTFMVPRNLAAAISPLGTTTIMPDPHEIANTCGMEGIRFMKRESQGLPVDMYFGAPSCVPASAYETPFEPLSAADMTRLFDEGTCTHLGEMMNFPGVFLGDGDTWAKLEAAHGRVITGHAPGVTEETLAGYILGGATSDHECSCEAEAMDKLRRGMYVMIRQGATARNLETLAPIVREDKFLSCRCMAVSDDISPDFMHERGHLDGCIRELIASGVEPLAALRMVTLSPAEYFRLDDRGALAPRRIADIVLVDSLENCRVLKVWKRGRLVAEDGVLKQKITPSVVSTLPGIAGKVTTPAPESLKVAMPSADAKMYVIGVIPGQVATKTLLLEPTTADGFAVADAARDIAKFAVVEKNRGTGRTAVGFLKDFGLTRGAVASSIAHDAHNFSCAGMDDISMAAALKELASMGGGIVVADGEKILARLELPVGGLMSLLPLDELRARIKPLSEARDALGCTNSHAFMQLAFLSLSVIPELKLTDQGYCDIIAGAMPLFAER